MKTGEYVGRDIRIKMIVEVQQDVRRLVFESTDKDILWDVEHIILYPVADFCYILRRQAGPNFIFL